MNITKDLKKLVHTSNCILDAWVEGERITPYEPHANVKLKPIPHELWHRQNSFFDAVYSAKKSEALMWWFYRDDGEWMLEPPAQEVASASVTTKGYEKEKQELILSMEQQGFKPMMTVHTHAAMAAFQSGTDSKDECDDGEFNLHITLGHLDKRYWDWDCRAKVVIPGIKDGLPVGKAIVDTVPFNITDILPVSALEKEMSKELKCLLIQHYLLMLRDIEYPMEWDDSIRERQMFQTYVSPHTPYNQSNVCVCDYCRTWTDKTSVFSDGKRFCSEECVKMHKFEKGLIQLHEL